MSEADSADTLLAIGQVGRPHGLDGAFVVIHPSDDPRRWVKEATVLVDGVEAKVVASHLAGRGRRIVRLDRRVQRGATLAVRRADLPPPEPGAWYAHDLVGLAVEDDEGGAIGVVVGVYPGVANDNLELDNGSLVPLIDNAVREIDLERRRVVVVAGFLGGSAGATDSGVKG